MTGDAVAHASEWNPSWIYLERLSQGLTQVDLALKTGLAPASISNAESRPGTRISTVFRICRDGLGLTIDDLVRKGAIHEATGEWPKRIRKRGRS